jgi:hypothetical protein
MPSKKITASKTKGKGKPAPKGKGKPATPPGKGKPKPEASLGPVSLVVALYAGKLAEVTTDRKMPGLKLTVIETDGATVDDLREAGEEVVTYTNNMGMTSDPLVIRGSTEDTNVTVADNPSFIKNLGDAEPEADEDEDDGTDDVADGVDDDADDELLDEDEE